MNILCRRATAWDIQPALSHVCILPGVDLAPWAAANELRVIEGGGRCCPAAHSRGRRPGRSAEPCLFISHWLTWGLQRPCIVAVNDVVHVQNRNMTLVQLRANAGGRWHAVEPTSCFLRFLSSYFQPFVLAAEPDRVPRKGTAPTRRRQLFRK